MSDITPPQAVPSFDGIWQLFKEADHLIKEQTREAERHAQEANRRFQETERFLKNIKWIPSSRPKKPKVKEET